MQWRIKAESVVIAGFIATQENGMCGIVIGVIISLSIATEKTRLSMAKWMPSLQMSVPSLLLNHKTWGAPKIRDKLAKQCPHIQSQAPSRIHAILVRHGLVKRRKRRRPKHRALS